MFEDYTPVEGDYPPGNPNMPFGYLAGLVAWMATSPDGWKIFNYHDINIKPGSSQQDYNSEFQKWDLAHRFTRAKHLLFQYDVDARPDVTEALLKVHIKAGVTANVMIFHERIWDKEFKTSGKIVIDESYKIDFGLLREFQASGGVVGYHCNVWERSLFDLEKSRELFERDLESIRKQIDIDVFSMHGGPLDEKGRSNAHIELHDTAEKAGVTWVHNGLSPSFHYQWDDGGAGHPNYKFRLADSSEVLSLAKPGTRMRILAHPQYYRCLNPGQVKNLNQQDFVWFKDMLQKLSEADKQFGKEYRGDFGRKTSQLFWKKMKPGNESQKISSTTDWFANHYWPGKYTENKKVDTTIENLVATQGEDNNPVFVNGMSRSGTTLMNALLDVHPDIAMSYELYPNYLTGHGDHVEKYIDFHALAYLIKNYPQDPYKIMQEADQQDFIRFMACAGHSDVSPADISNVLIAYLRTRPNIYYYEDALKIVEICARLKMVRIGKKTWGAKAQGKFDKYKSIWPKSRFIYMLRDGRDILASQKNIGSFNPDAEKVAKSWVSRVGRFIELARSGEITGIVVRYENLVNTPEKELQKVCEFLEIRFSENMLNHCEHDISLLHEPRGQLSAKRIAKPIDKKAIGRWKNDLSKEEIKIFLDIAGETLDEHGYM